MIRSIDFPRYFDVAELLAATGHESLDAARRAFAAAHAETLGAGLKAWRIWDEAGGRAFLLIAFEPGIEASVDTLFAADPAKGYLAMALAQAILTRTLGALVPEAATHGCAPLVAPPASVREAMAQLGVTWKVPGSLSRALAVLTPLPWRGGCEICLLLDGCPKKRG